MTDKISQARQKLRDYAREQCGFVIVDIDTGETSHAGTARPLVRGEAGGKVFVALQEALRVAEELREESREQDPKVEINGRKVIFPENASYKDAQAAAADRIEAAVFMALAY
jgi:hypothetical protein